MLGHVVLTGEKGWKTVVDRYEVLGLSLLRVSIPGQSGRHEKRLERRIDRAARRLREAGVRRVLTASDFSYWERLEAQGLKGVDPGPMCQTMAAELALAALEGGLCPPERAVVALRGGRVSRTFFQAAVALCARVRGVAVCAPSGGGELADYLRREFGLPVLEREQPALTLEFSPVSGENHGEPVMVLHGPSLSLLGLSLGPEQPVPEGLDPLPLTAALWEEGYLTKPHVIMAGNFAKQRDEKGKALDRTL